MWLSRSCSMLTISDAPPPVLLVVRVHGVTDRETGDPAADRHHDAGHVEQRNERK